MSSDRGCCPFERLLGLGVSQSAGRSAEEACRRGTNEGEAQCLRGVEIAPRYYLDRPYNGALPDGAELKEFERSEHPELPMAIYMATCRMP